MILTEVVQNDNYVSLLGEQIEMAFPFKALSVKLNTDSITISLEDRCLGVYYNADDFDDIVAKCSGTYQGGGVDPNA